MKSSTSFGFSSSLLFFFIVAASINVVNSEDAASINEDFEDIVSFVPNITNTLCSSYELMVETGDIEEGGTESSISVTLANTAGERVEIPDLKKWGTMPPGHKYFQRGNQDHFSVKPSSCFRTYRKPPCHIIVTSDGSGLKPGWFLERVKLYTEFSLNHHFSINFEFNQWLAIDEPPKQLTESRDKCK